MNTLSFAHSLLFLVFLLFAVTCFRFHEFFVLSSGDRVNSLIVPSIATYVLHLLLNLLFDISTSLIGYHVDAVVIRIMHSSPRLILTRLLHATLASILPELSIDHIQTIQLENNDQRVLA